jgi:TPR repeat protein
MGDYEYELGYKYLYVEKNLKEAVRWIKESAYLNNPKAQYELGVMCHTSKISNPLGNYMTAIYW